MVQLCSTERLKPYIQSEPVPVRSEHNVDTLSPNLVYNLLLNLAYIHALCHEKNRLNLSVRRVVIQKIQLVMNKKDNKAI